MGRRNKKGEKVEGNPTLVLSSPDGAPWASFPSSVIDPMRRLISRIDRNGEIPARLAFVAALRQEGVSYVSQAFATTMAYDFETSVCLVDLNWWWPSELSIKVSASSRGIGAILSGKTTLKEAIVRTGNPNLTILPAGELNINERALFSRSVALNDTIADLTSRYDHLVLDIPAVLASNDAIPLASLSEACCLVIHQGITPIADVKSALRDLDHIPQLGVVMNKFHLAVPRIMQRFVYPYP